MAFNACQLTCLYKKQLVFLIGILDSQIPSKGVVSIQNETKPMKGDKSKKQKKLKEREGESAFWDGSIFILSRFLGQSCNGELSFRFPHRGIREVGKSGERRDELSRTVKECKLKNMRSLSVNSFFEGSATCLRVFSTTTGLN